jgi:hypothetical protein
MASYGGFENLVFVSDNNQIFKSVNSFKEVKGLVQLVYNL